MDQIFAVNGVAVMAIFALVQDAVLEMRDVGNEGVITAILPVDVAGTLRGWPGGRMRSRRRRSRSRMRFDASVMSISTTNVADLVGVVVGAGVILVPVSDPLPIFMSSLAIIKNPVAKMNSLVFFFTVWSLARRVWVVAAIVTPHPVGTVRAWGYFLTLDAVVDVFKVAASPTGASGHMFEAVALVASVAVGAVGIDIAISLAQPEFFARVNYF